MAWPNNRYIPGGRQGRGGGGIAGSPVPSPWWQKLIWIIVLLLFVLIIWLLTKGRKRQKRKKIKRRKSKLGK